MLENDSQSFIASLIASITSHVEQSLGFSRNCESFSNGLKVGYKADCLQCAKLIG
jgi:hypothetical protein